MDFQRNTIDYLHGIFPPVTTPFNSRGELDEESFCENLLKYVSMRLSGVVVAGSTGEAPFLAASERLRLVTLARQIVPPPRLLIVGTGLEGTGETIRLSREAVRRGADALLVVPPNYYKARIDAAAQIAHYSAVADAVRCSVLIYSIPQFTGIHMSVETIATLSEHPNIVGLKDSSGDLSFVRAVLKSCRAGFRVLAGTVAILPDAVWAGAVGGVVSQANFVPTLCLSLYEASLRKDYRLVAAIRRRIEPLIADIVAPFGVAGIKAALDECGYYGGPPRLPLQGLSAVQLRRVKGAIKASSCDEAASNPFPA
jgi:4-hydroxy-2-oxoglutarate aldolase